MRKEASLETLVTDLHTLYYSPTSLPPLQVDSDKKGKDSDHSIVVFSPRTNQEYFKKLDSKLIQIRPLPDCSIRGFGQEIVQHE